MSKDTINLRTALCKLSATFMTEVANVPDADIDLNYQQSEYYKRIKKDLEDATTILALFNAYKG